MPAKIDASKIAEKIWDASFRWHDICWN